MNSALKQLPIVEGLFTESSDNPQLIGGKCQGCNTYFFPFKPEVHAPTCNHREAERVKLSRRGKLVSYTIHNYPPPPPFKMEPFQPYAIGLVELPENLQVIGMLTGFALDGIALGADVELVTEGLYTDEEGNEVVTWKWQPIQQERAIKEIG